MAILIKDWIHKLEKDKFYLIKKAYHEIYLIVKIYNPFPDTHRGILMYQDQFGGESVIDDDDEVIGSIERIVERQHVREKMSIEFYKNKEIDYAKKI